MKGLEKRPPHVKIPTADFETMPSFAAKINMNIHKQLHYIRKPGKQRIINTKNSADNEH